MTWDPKPAEPASSLAARAFDAGVSTSSQGTALFYVVARDGAPDAAVRSVGGEVLTRLPNPCQVLALAPIAAHAKLRDHSDLSLAGPISVDPKRFDRFIRMTGVNLHPVRTTSP